MSDRKTMDVPERPYPELLSKEEGAELLKWSEGLWAELQENKLGGFSGINRPFHIKNFAMDVIEKFGNRDVGLNWSKNDLDNYDHTRAASGQDNQAAVEAVKCPQCGRSAELEVRYTNIDGTWEPICRSCQQNNEAQSQEVIEHEMKHFGGAYGFPTWETRPLSTPSISLPQLKAICEGMKAEVSGREQTGWDAALVQVYEAAEKGRG